MSASVTISPTRLHRMLGASGLGGRLLRRKAEQVAALARINAASHGSIASTISAVPNGDRSWKVVSAHHASLWVHNGTPRHPIRPRRRGGFLRFQVDGQTVYARAVSHPGYKGDDFLARALREVIG